MTKKILAFAMMLLIALSLTGCLLLTNRIKVDYDTLEELQGVCPDYYFFNFDENIVNDFYGTAFFSETETNSCSGEKERKIESYTITIDCIAKSQDSKSLIITIWGDMYNNLLNQKYINCEVDESFIMEYIIDNITCRLFTSESRVFDNKYTYGLELLFWIEERFYVISFEELLYLDEPAEEIEKTTAEYFMSVVEPAIINRYKGLKT